MTTDLHAHIKLRRHELGLTQGALAKIVGVSRGTIRNVEAGKPMEDATLRGIEHALGWLPETTEPYVSGETMRTISQGFLARTQDAPAYDLRRIRSIYHAFFAELHTGKPGPGHVDDFTIEIMQAVPRSAGDAALSELATVANKRGRAVRGDMAGTLPSPMAKAEANVQRDDAAGTVEQKSARQDVVVTGPAGNIRLGGSPGAVRAEPPRRSWDAGPVTAHPALIPINDEENMLIVAVPVATRFMAELNDDDLRGLTDSLRAQGMDLVRTIVRAKRQERARRGFEIQAEFPPIGVRTENQGGFESRSEWPELSVNPDQGDEPEETT